MALRRVIATDTWPRAAFGLTLTSHVYRDSGPPSENAICIIYPIHHQHRAARNFGVFCVLLQQQMECRRPTLLRKPTHLPPPSHPSQVNCNSARFNEGYNLHPPVFVHCCFSCLFVSYHFSQEESMSVAPPSSGEAPCPPSHYLMGK